MAWYEWGNRLSRLLKQQVDRSGGLGPGGLGPVRT